MENNQLGTTNDNDSKQLDIKIEIEMLERDEKICQNRINQILNELNSPVAKITRVFAGASRRKTLEYELERLRSESSQRLKQIKKLKMNRDFNNIRSETSNVASSIKDGSFFKNKRNIIIILAIVIVLLLSLLASLAGRGDTEVDFIEDYRIKIQVERDTNFMFSTYDVVVYLDDTKLGVIGNGTDRVFSERVEKGSHTIDFVNAENVHIHNIEYIHVKEDAGFRFTIKTHSDKIECDEGIYTDSSFAATNQTVTTTSYTTTTTLPVITTTQEISTTTEEYISHEDEISFDDESFSIYDNIPVYSGEAYVTLNDNEPVFDDYVRNIGYGYEYYSNLDSLGRCGEAYACIGEDLMPTEKREGIGQVKPSGWHTVKYDFISGNYLYNRCHLIAFELAGENANEKDLITGTRYMNIKGMLPFENMVHDYVKETGNHVIYKVTPVFVDRELVARGVQIEAFSMEDDGDGISFNIYCFNVQPGVVINYSNGDSKASGEGIASNGDVTSSSSAKVTTRPSTTKPATTAHTTAANHSPSYTYILNTNTSKFHNPNCSTISRMNPSNKQEITCSREECIKRGFSPCGKCNP